MGAEQTNYFPRNKWQFVSRNDNFEVYINGGGQLAEKHMIPNDLRFEQSEEMNSYLQRYNSQYPIVQVYDAEYETSQNFCSNHKNITVMTEYIPYRLAETKNLNHEQALYVLSQSLAGFHFLHHRLGAFPVDHHLIGFNSEGHTKVWHNHNFAKNHFERDNIILMSTENPHDFDRRMLERQQEEMVEDIYNAVAQHSLLKPQFREEAFGFRQFGFEAARKFVEKEIIHNGKVTSGLRFSDKSGILQRSRLSHSRRGTMPTHYYNSVNSIQYNNGPLPEGNEVGRESHTLFNSRRSYNSRR